MRNRIREARRVVLDFYNAFLDEPLEVRNGELLVPKKPGLGARLDVNYLEALVSARRAREHQLVADERVHLDGDGIRIDQPVLPDAMPCEQPQLSSPIVGRG